MPDYRFKYVKARYDSPVGRYISEWKIKEDGSLYFKFEVPFNATATLSLPDADLNSVTVNGRRLEESGLEINNNSIELVTGMYEFKYIPTKDYVRYYNTNMSLNELLANEEIKEILGKELQAAVMLPPYMVSAMGNESIRALATKPFFNVTEEEMDRTDEIIGKIKYVINE